MKNIFFIASALLSSQCYASKFEQVLQENIDFYEQKNGNQNGLKMEFITEPVNLAATKVVPTPTTAHTTNTTVGTPTDIPNHSDTTGQNTIKQNRAYTTVMIGCGILMLIMIIDLWVIMDDGTKPLVPYYLVSTDSQMEE